MYKLNPPIEAVWPFGDFPEAIEIDGVVFYRAVRKQPYAGVIEQYRAAVPTHSAHMFVKDDGTYMVHHVDEYNPDMGHPVRHFVVDHPVGRLLALTGSGILTMGIAIKRGFGDVKRDNVGLIKR